MFTVTGDGPLVGNNIIPGVITGLADGNIVGKVVVGEGTNKISHAVSVGVPLVQPKVAEVVVIPVTVNAVGFGQVGKVVNVCGPAHVDGNGAHSTRT